MVAIPLRSGGDNLSHFGLPDAAKQRVLIDIDGVRASFALTSPRRPGIFSLIKEYRSSDFPTATDCVMRFAKDANIVLEGMDCAVAVSGAVSGDAIRIARCPWIISARGFGYLFKTPVHFLNDSAALLWAATHVAASTHRLLGIGALPDFKKGGKWLGINYQSGLGAALLVSTDGSVFQHVETEAGHTAFAPLGDAERTMCKNLERIKWPASWERALFANAEDPAWRDTPVFGDTRLIAAHRAKMLGSFVGDMILATGGWDGVILFGGAAALVSSPASLGLFDKRAESRANFQVQLRKVPRWAVSMPHINLVGASRFLEHRCEDKSIMA
jgi:glucokinase